MRQAEIVELLKEAAHPNCPWQRINEIQCRLGDAVAAPDGADEIDTPEDGIRAVFSAIYMDTVKNRPEILPTLFPLFAALCGDRDKDTIITDVDWSLMK